MEQIFNIYGLIIMCVIMIPNIVFSRLNKNGFNNKYQNKLVETLEQIGRFSTFGLMIINIPVVTLGYWFVNAKIIYSIINVILCFLYCMFWCIYWKKNCLAKSLLLSIIPSMIFIFSGITLLNIPLIIASIIFAINHILISYKNAIL